MENEWQRRTLAKMVIEKMDAMRKELLSLQKEVQYKIGKVDEVLETCYKWLNEHKEEPKSES